MSRRAEGGLTKEKRALSAKLMDLMPHGAHLCDLGLWHLDLT